MGDEALAHRARAGNDVEHACRQGRLLADFGEKQRSERGLLRWFQNHSIAHGEGGCHLPCQHQKRKIPGDDLPANAYGLAVGQGAGHQLRHAGVIVEMAVGKGNIDVAALSDRFAIV